MNKTILAVAALLLAGCATDQVALRHNTERNCRVEAAVNPAYAVDARVTNQRNVAFDRCMAARGFRGR